MPKSTNPTNRRICINNTVVSMQFNEVKRYLESKVEYQMSDSQVIEVLLVRYLATEKADIKYVLPRRMV